MLCCNASSSTIGTTEHDWTWHIPSRHVICLSSRVDNLVNGLHCEVKSHELAAGDWGSIFPNLFFGGRGAYIGRRPASAAPVARPAKPISVIGVSTTRFSPN